MSTSLPYDKYLKTAPVDEEGFIVSFTTDQVDAIRKFFDEYGFVCIRDVLTDEEIKDTLGEFFSHFDPDNDASIEEFFRRQRFGRFGIIGDHPDKESITLLNNRQNERVYKAFVAVIGETDLIVDHDRIGAMRPTYTSNGVERPTWRTIDRWLHLDCNPITGGVSVASFANTDAKHNWDNGFLLQGFLSLTDAREKDGGFHCVPGGHKIALEWARAHGKESAGSTLGVDADDPIRNWIQKISIRRGCLFVWSSFLFHANRPNYSDKWRIVQYIRMYVKHKTPFEPLFPFLGSYPSYFQMTPLGAKLFGTE